MKKTILEKHLKDKKSSRQIASLENTSQTNVRYWIKKHGLNLPNNKKKYPNENKIERNRRTSQEAYYSKKRQIKCKFCEKTIQKRLSTTEEQSCIDCYKKNARLFV